MKTLSLFAILLSFKAFAISETNYQENFEKFVRPVMKKMQKGYLNSNGTRLHYLSLENPNASDCFVILPGRSESAIKYSEMVYDLMSSIAGSKLNFFVLDHRGQGESDRMTPKWDMGYVDSFSNYTSDLNYFISNVVLKKDCRKKYLFAHSMGAGIALSYLIDHQNVFDEVFISSPMLKIQTKPFSYKTAKAIVSSMVLIGKGDDFAKGQKGFDPSSQFEDNKFTTSKARYQMTMNLFNEFPTTQLGGASNKWIYEVMKGTQKVRSKYYDLAMPIHLYRAGDEQYSEPEEMHKFCVLAQNCKETLLKNSKHEVVNDSDENRNVVLSDIIRHLIE